MLDVHILTLPDTRRDWQRECIASVREAAATADFPVHVHVIPGVPGHLGRARAMGYSAGIAPWKCYVDDDDFVLPGAFDVLGPHLLTDVAAIFPREYVEQNGRRHDHTMGRHHLWPVRTDLTARFPHADYAAMPDEALRRHAASDPRGVIDLDDVLYVHRVWGAQRCRGLRRQHRAEVASVLMGAP